MGGAGGGAGEGEDEILAELQRKQAELKAVVSNHCDLFSSHSVCEGNLSHAGGIQHGAEKDSLIFSES